MCLSQKESDKCTCQKQKKFETNVTTDYTKHDASGLRIHKQTKINITKLKINKLHTFGGSNSCVLNFAILALS